MRSGMRPRMRPRMRSGMRMRPGVRSRIGRIGSRVGGIGRIGREGSRRNVSRRREIRRNYDGGHIAARIVPRIADADPDGDVSSINANPKSRRVRLSRRDNEHCDR